MKHVICSICNKEFDTNYKRTKFCSNKCRRVSYLRTTGRVPCWKNIPSATVGAIQELRAGVDLLKKGYEVFRALSPACSCDLVALKNGNIFKLEVRTAYKNKKGEIFYTKTHIKAEFLALALPNSIVYKPELK